MILDYIVYILLGFVVGTVVGISGLGGGAMMTPALILIGIEPLVAVGTDLVYNTICKVFATIFYKVKGNIDFKMAIKLFIGSLPAIVVGYFILKAIDRDLVNDYLTLVLGILLVIVSIATIIRSYQKGESKSRLREYFGERKNLMTFSLILIGVVVAFTVQFTSVGAGILVTLALLNMTKMNSKMVVGTSLFYGLLLGIVSAISHMGLGTVNYTIAMFLVIGAIPGIFAGGFVNQKVSQRSLRRLLTGLILVLGLIILGSAILNLM